LESVGVKTEKNGKIVCNDDDTTTAANIFAIGDCVHSRLELTPTAIYAGRLLSNRLFGGASDLMNYKFVPTTVFTPIEYGCIGYSEEDALKHFGEENIKVYYGNFKPLEWVFSDDREEDEAYGKLIVNLLDSERVVGFHYMGPHAGEVTQGFGTAIKMGATRKDFAATVGIHPTSAEEMVGLKNIKGGEEEKASGC